MQRFGGWCNTARPLRGIGANMIGKILAAIVLVSGLRADLDYLLNSLVFSQPTANAEPLNNLLTGRELSGAVIAATFFVLIYTFIVRRKTFVTGTVYGLVFGLVAGAVFVFFPFTSAAPTLTRTAVRFLADICQATLAGMITALVLKTSGKKEKPQRIVEEI